MGLILYFSTCKSKNICNIAAYPNRYVFEFMTTMKTAIREPGRNFSDSIIVEFYRPGNQGKMFDEASILDELSSNLRQEVINYNCRHLVGAVPVSFRIQRLAKNQRFRNGCFVYVASNK